MPRSNKPPIRQPIHEPPKPGSRFGGWTVLSDEVIFMGKAGRGRGVQCRCDCGKEKPVLIKALLNGKSRGCNRWCRGEEGGPLAEQDYTGQRVGKLVYLEPGPLKANSHRTWVMQCDCGNVTIVPLEAIRRGRYVSCGHCLSDNIFHRQFSLLWRERIKYYRKLGQRFVPNIRPYDTWYGFKKNGQLCPEWESSFVDFLQYWLVLTGTTLEEWFEHDVPWRSFETYRPDEDQPASPENLELAKFISERAWHQDTYCYWRKLKRLHLLSPELEDSYLLFLNSFGVKVAGRLLKRKDITKLHSYENSEWINIPRYSKKLDST